MLERTRETKGKTSRERAYFIGSKGVTCAEAFATAARRHWGIENSLHWVLDVIFCEDDCRVRKGHAPQNFSTLPVCPKTIQENIMPCDAICNKLFYKGLFCIAIYKSSPLQNPSNPQPERRLVDSSSPESPRN
jgi:hypothetical protein